MDWKECIKKKIAKRVQVDTNLIDSLIKTSGNKLISENKLAMEDTTAGSKISLVYDSLRELLEALSIKSGYKIYNHEGYTPFLKEIIKKTTIGEEFDEIRKIRNSINYYGKSVSAEEAVRVIERIKILREAIYKILIGIKY
jgi:putative ubiquitin-RnfH superfamily antitoxin RatB of RatAB toxin-antitoxin module